MINFKDRIMRRKEESNQQLRMTDRSPIEKQNDGKNWFQYYQSNCRTSQRRDYGDFQRSSQNQPQLIIKEDRLTPKSQIIKKARNHQQQQRSSQHYQVSMKTSKQPTEQLFQSKLEETKGQISEQLSALEGKIQQQMYQDRKFMEKQHQQTQETLYKNIQLILDQDHKRLEKHIQKMLAKSSKQNSNTLHDIVRQINKVIDGQTKTIARGKKQNEKKIQEFRAQLDRTVKDLEEKIQRVTVSGEGVKKSKNVGDYSVDLKSSIHEICINNPIQNSIPAIDEARMKEIQDTIKNLKLQIIQIKTNTKFKEIKQIPSSQSFYQNKSQVQKEMSFLSERIKAIEEEVHQTKSQNQNKCNELHRIASVQEENIKGMNEQFTKVINAQMLPRLKCMEDECKNINHQLTQKVQQHYDEKVQEKLNSMKIINIRHLKESQKDKLGIEGGIGYKQTYMLDEDGFILDSRGAYLVDDSDQRIKVEEEQIYWLRVQGIQIVN